MKVLVSVTSHTFLGVWIQENFKWINDVTKTVSSSFEALSTITKIRNMPPKALRKNLAHFFEAWYVWSSILTTLYCIHYSSTLKQNYGDFMMPASFVKEVTQKCLNVVGLGWLLVKERTKFHLLRTTHMALYDTQCPSYIVLNSGEKSNYQESKLRCYTQLVVPLKSGNFQESASRLFNSAPNDIKLECNAKTFARKV